MSRAGRKSKRKRSKKLQKQFSTISEGTLHSPSISLCLELVSKLILRHILLRDGCVESRRDKEWEEKFDVDNFLAKKYNCFMPFAFMNVGASFVFFQEQQKCRIVIPSFEDINLFLVSVFNKLHLNVESSIVCLMYTERLMDKRHISLTPRNWRPIIIASILTASKVWDDLSSWNIEFSNLLPVLTLSNINKLEGLYLQALQYDLYISSSEYAKYYFALRGLKNTKTELIPRYYLDMKIIKSNKNKRKSSKSRSRMGSGASASASNLDHRKGSGSILNLNINESFSKRARDFQRKTVVTIAQQKAQRLKNNQNNSNNNDNFQSVSEEKSSRRESYASLGVPRIVEEEEDQKYNENNRSLMNVNISNNSNNSRNESELLHSSGNSNNSEKSNMSAITDFSEAEHKSLVLNKNSIGGSEQKSNNGNNGNTNININITINNNSLPTVSDDNGIEEEEEDVYAVYMDNDILGNDSNGEVNNNNSNRLSNVVKMADIIEEEEQEDGDEDGLGSGSGSGSASASGSGSYYDDDDDDDDDNNAIRPGNNEFLIQRSKGINIVRAKKKKKGKSDVYPTSMPVTIASIRSIN